MKTKLATMAAAMLAATGASAADLGRPAPAAVDYVKVCDAYGTGFFYIPGTQTCLKIDGYVRAELRTGDSDWYYRTWTWNSAAEAYAVTTNWAGSIGGNDRTRDDVRTRARALLDFDARTNTEFGLLRSYIQAYFTIDSGTTSPVTALDFAYIQWGGLTAGRAQSFFDFHLGYGYQMLSHEMWGDAKTNLFAYTFAFGNGISASLSIEDPSTNARRRGSTSDLALFATSTATVSGSYYHLDLADHPVYGFAYQGVKLPDVVANLRIDQAWGSAQIAAAAHHIYGRNASTTVDASVFPVPNHNKDDWGWAVMGGVSVNLPMLAAGDAAFLQGGYTEGALAYLCLDCINFRSIGADAVIGLDGGLKTTKAWVVSGGFKHNFTSTVEFNIEGGYADIDGYGARDYAQWEGQAALIWRPVSGLQIGTSLEYRNIDFSSATTRNFTGGHEINDTWYRVKDADAWLLGLRVQRTF